MYFKQQVCLSYAFGINDYQERNGQCRAKRFVTDADDGLVRTLEIGSLSVSKEEGFIGCVYIKGNDHPLKLLERTA